MIDSIVGAVIMVVATTSLLYALEVAEAAFSQSGRYPLNADERTLLKDSIQLSDDEVDDFWTKNLENAPRQVTSDD
jgi:hypothetical protein